MGKFEKLVVLAVLLAAAVVLAFSFNRGSKVHAADPLGGADDLLDSGLGAPAPGAMEKPDSLPQGTAPEAATETAPSLLLHAGSEAGLHKVEDASSLTAKPAEPAAPASTLSLEPISDKGRTILADTNGLRPSFLDEYMQYTVAEGDTWSSLALRFYRDERYTQNLNLANEGLADLTPGKTILVPVFDFVATESKSGSKSELDAPATETAAAPMASFAPAPKDSAPEKADSAKPVTPVTGQEYEVRAGDTLSDISMAVFGTATRWQELLEFNKDRLSKPEALRVGMKLRIPAGGKMPAAAVAKASTPKKSESKKSEAAKAPSSTKKRKVL
jgi:nucleoid-associated protein YgaU